MPQVLVEVVSENDARIPKIQLFQLPQGARILDEIGQRQGAELLLEDAAAARNPMLRKEDEGVVRRV